MGCVLLGTLTFVFPERRRGRTGAWLLHGAAVQGDVGRSSPMEVLQDPPAHLEKGSSSSNEGKVLGGEPPGQGLDL